MYKDSTKSLFLSLCCLMTPDLSKDTGAMYDHTFLCLQINKAYISPQVKWAVNVVIASDDFDFPQWFKLKLNLLTGLNFIRHIQLIKHHIHHKCIKKDHAILIYENNMNIFPGKDIISLEIHSSFLILCVSSLQVHSSDITTFNVFKST